MKIMKTGLEPWKTYQEPWKTMKTDMGRAGISKNVTNKQNIPFIYRYFIFVICGKAKTNVFMETVLKRGEVEVGPSP